MKLRAEKPKDFRYPKELTTLADHIRKRRLDLRLLQRQVAERIGVTAATVWQWERNRTDPETRYLPAVFQFLGYVPNGSGTSFPEVLRIARRTAGLTQEQLAKRAGVDESGIAKWERGETLPFARTVQRLRRFFTKIGRPLPDLGPDAFYGLERRAEAAPRAWRSRGRQRVTTVPPTAVGRYPRAE